MVCLTTYIFIEWLKFFFRPCENCRENKRRVVFDFQDKKTYSEYWATDFAIPDLGKIFLIGQSYLALTLNITVEKLYNLAVISYVPIKKDNE